MVGGVQDRGPVNALGTSLGWSGRNHTDDKGDDSNKALEMHFEGECDWL